MRTLGVLEIELLGTSRALETLRRLPYPPETVVVSALGRVLLRTDAFANRPESHSAAAYAQAVVQSLNCLAAIVDPEHQPVSVGEVRSGSGSTYATFSATVQFRESYTFTKRARTLPPPSLKAVRAVLGIPEVREALAVWARPRTWAHLWKILEIIRGDGKRDWAHVRSMAGIPAKELDSFLESANNPRFGGSETRHARTTVQHSDAKPMSLPDAEDLVRVVLHAWLEQTGSLLQK